MKLKPYLLLLLSLLGYNTSYSQIISTVAGNGTYGNSGDGGPATAAQLGDLYQVGVAADNAGNIYFPIAGNSNVIKKVNSAGIISTIAGNGGMGYSGDGGPATAARLYHPSGIVVDDAGNIIFADQNGAVIRKVNTAGIITTISGPTTFNCTGDGGPLSNASFNTISGMTRDAAGNIYISDQGCNTIRKVNTAGIITTVAGNGTGGFSGDGGPATAAQLQQPFQPGVDNAGNIYIPDANNVRVRKVNPAGIITTIAGTGTQGFSGNGGPAILAQFDTPGSVCTDNAGNIYVADVYNNVVRKIDNAGIVTAFAGNGTPGYTGDGGPAAAAQLTTIHNVSIDNAGNIYLVDYYNYVIRKVTNCPTASITQQPAMVSLCNTGNAVFNISATNVSNYQWQVNPGSGWTDITDNATYAGAAGNTLSITGATTAMNNYLYRCLLSNGCGTVYSLSAPLTVSTPATPVATVTTGSTTICAGTNVTFNAFLNPADPAAVYQWQKNGINTGNNSSTYSDNSLNNGDQVSCIITSTASCLTTATATSNVINMTVNPRLTPAISITASTNNICFGTPVTFTATTVNAGPAPHYTWFKNNINLLFDSPVYTDNSLNNGDVIMGVVRSSLACVTSEIVPSLPIFVTVNPLLTPAVSITASATAVCRNTPVTFIATAVNGGSAPVYQWKKNGQPVGNNSAIYTDNALLNGDQVTCELTANSACLTTTQANGNIITISINPDPVVTLDQTSTLCTGSSRVLDAGSFSSYLWNNGSTSQIITVNSIGTYSVTVTDNNGCTGSASTSISTLFPLPSGFAPPDTAICSYGNITLKADPGYPSYVWSNGSTLASITITQPGEYWLQVTDNNDCTHKEFITVNPKECLKGFYIPTAFTPNNDGKNDVFKPMLFGNIKQYSFRIFNRWGQVVFETRDINRGWEGDQKSVNQDSNVFVWICRYQLEGESIQTEKGTVLLVK